MLDSKTDMGIYEETSHTSSHHPDTLSNTRTKAREIPEFSVTPTTDTMDIMYDVFLTSMNNIKRITGFSLVAGMFLIAALATSTVRTAFAQNTSNSNQ